ncbi:uncharacterized protein [Palaemon carinicauda]|uniref:uncharacterized protein n=1 Tax=Palaemon carinicauda TaxID=392227 RepID=UPI0035B68207
MFSDEIYWFSVILLVLFIRLFEISFSVIANILLNYFMKSNILFIFSIFQLVLLALVGLASCRVAFFDDDRRDVRIKYSIDEDDDDREVEVDYDYRPRAVSTFIRQPEPAQYFRVAAPRPEVRTQYVEVESPRPVYTQVVPVRPAPRTTRTQVVTQYVQAEPTLASIPRVTIPVVSAASPVVVPQSRPSYVTQQWNTFSRSNDDSSEDK